MTKPDEQDPDPGFDPWWFLADPDVVLEEPEGPYGGYRYVRKSNGQVVCWGQKCFPMSHFLERMKPEDRFRWDEGPPA